MAFDIFRRARVDFAVVEVGLGGRLDSTNVVDPIVTAITSIDFDHQQYLGNTLAEIAGEKAGIIKIGVPVIVGEVAAEAYDIIERTANERRAPLIRADSISREWDSVHVGLRGTHQRANAKVAIAVLETLERSGTKVSTQAIIEGLANVSWPGRLDHRTLPNGHEIVLDAAHNPAGARALASYLRGLRCAKPTLVFGAMRDKDVDAMLAVLLPEVGRVIVTKPSNPRAAEPEDLAQRIAALAPSLSIDVVASPRDAVAAATSDSPLVVVAGSIFLLGDVLQGIGA
jgi:dihydrofolate synthase/folylpolyglutamate synthase